jgi:signal transduction histidine kinase
LHDSVQRMSQFTADASHELRAPVSLIRTTAELAVGSGRSNQDYHDDMKHILAEAERTSRLIDSLLLLARADSGEDGLQMEPTDLNVSIREAVDQARSLAKDRDVSLEAHFSGDPIVVSGDGDALRRLVFILVDNAVKYSPAGGVVHVFAKATEGEAICTVSDSGIGISQDDLKHIFDRFWRADKVRSRGMGGAGLGLSIALWITDRHNGALGAQSELGRGTTFTLRLPLSSVYGRSGAGNQSSV